MQLRPPRLIRFSAVSLTLAAALACSGCPGSAVQEARPCNADTDCRVDERCEEGFCEDYTGSPLSPEPTPTTTDAGNEPDVLPIDGGDDLDASFERDAGETDGGAFDGGDNIDAGNPDAGPSDDAGPITDAGAPGVDSGIVDAGGPIVDSGPADAGTPDAGPVLPTDAFDDPWAFPTHARRARYRIAAGRADSLQNFPMALTVEADDFQLNVFDGHLSTLVVTDVNGAVLPVEIDEADENHAHLWVRLNIIGRTNSQVIYAYVADDGTPGPTLGGVWTDNVLRVYHFAEGKLLVDSVEEAVATSPDPTPAGGVIGQGYDLEAADIDFPNISFPETGVDTSGTFSFWWKPDVNVASERLLFGNAVGNQTNCITVSQLGTSLRVRAYDESGAVVANLETYSGIRSWMRVTISWTTARLALMDGDFNNASETISSNLWRGPANQRVVFRAFPGTIDEFQIHSVYRGSSWAVFARGTDDDEYVYYETSPLPGLPAESSSVNGPSNPILRYTFDEGDGPTAHDTSGELPPIDLTLQLGDLDWGSGTLTLRAGARLQSTVSTDRIREAISASNAISVEAWLRSDHPLQSGPARVFTLSQDTSIRSFSLGQNFDTWVLRLTTSATGTNGSSNGSESSPPGAESSQTVSLGLDHIVLVRDADGVARTYRNGVLVGTKPWPGDLDNWSPLDVIAVGNEASTNSRPWTGTLGSLSLYDRALTDVEIAASFAQGSP